MEGNPLRWSDTNGLSPNDLNTIGNIFNDTLGQLHANGQRWPNLHHYNNMCAWYPYLPYCSGKERDCGGQALDFFMNLDNAQNNGMFDDKWYFVVDGAFANMWTGGVNLSNPTEWFTGDPRSGSFQTQGLCKTCSGAFGQKGSQNNEYNQSNKNNPFKPQSSMGHLHH